MKKILKVFLTGFCAFMLTTNLVLADEETDSKHSPIGMRSVSVEKRLAELETREQMGSVQSEESKREVAVKAKKGMKMMAPIGAKSVYYTSHPGAYQDIMSISYYGDMIELRDGSHWEITSLIDRLKTRHWSPTDVIVITPNHSWFSASWFRLTNQYTGESVEANLHLGPIAPVYGSFYTHWIVSIDYYHNIVYLEDGSTWYMSSLDSDIVNQWIASDVVIIGVNDGWLSGTNPNVLINVAMLNYAAGAAVF